MIKRKIVIGNYDTAANGWTMTSWKLSDPQAKTKYEDKPGGDGTWDLTTALTDGLVRYKDRTLTVTLECSEGDRLSREAKISQLVNSLEGMVESIELPDDPYHHIKGRIHVARNYSDMAHAKLTVTATCAPWRYSNTETTVKLIAATTEKVAKLVNGGRLAVVPLLTVTGSGASVRVAYGTSSLSMAAGTYKWPELLLTPGSHDLSYSGSGVLTISYREAVL